MTGNLLLGVVVNGTPLQYSCLENPMDGGAWQAADHGVVNQAAVYGVTQSQT